MEAANNFTAQFTVVDHGYLVSTTKGERFAYETKESLLKAFIRIFEIEPAPAAAAAVAETPAPVKEKKLELEIPAKETTMEVVEKTNQDQEELRLEPKPELEPEPKPLPAPHLEPVAEDTLFVSVSEVEHFSPRFETTHAIGKSKYQKKGDVFHIQRTGYMVSVWISLKDLLHLKRHPEDLKRVARDFANNKRTILTSFIYEAVCDDGTVAEGVVETSPARKKQVSPWKSKQGAKPLTGIELSFEDAATFSVSGLVGERVGKSVIYREGGVVAFTRSKCPETVYVKEDRVKSLMELNRVMFNDSTESLGAGGQGLLWDCLEDMKDDAMGCFRMISHDTRPDQPKLDSVSDGYPGS